MDRETLLRHIRATHFESGDRELALADARRVAAYLAEQGASRVVGIGSAFEPSRPFTDRSDIDLVVEGIEPARFFAVSAGAAAMTDFRLDLTPLEVATEALRRVVSESGRRDVVREEDLARRLATEIESELASLTALGEELGKAPRQDDIYSLRARGSILHDFCNGVERVFLRIARELNGGVPRGDQWHRDLVDDMTLEIPEVRPAVIDQDLARALGDYLRFRHLFRNVYGGVLDAERMASLERRLPETLAAFRERVEAFVAWMLDRD